MHVQFIASRHCVCVCVRVCSTGLPVLHADRQRAHQSTS